MGSARVPDDVLVSLTDVIAYDCKVTLFYEKGAASRFVRQKLLFNIWPVEQHKAQQQLADVRSDPYVYAYFYGLAVHKLAHFFERRRASNPRWPI